MAGLKISRQAYEEVAAALRVYEAEVSTAPMAQTTKNTYLLHARNFVRWLRDDFTPGATKSR